MDIKKVHSFIIPLLSAFLATSPLTGQTTDFGLWTSLGLEKEYDKWELSAEAEFRAKNNAATIDRWSLEVEAEREMLKHVKAGAGYKFICFHDMKYLDYQPRHRFYLYLQGKLEHGDFSFYLREFIQVTTKDESSRIKENGTTDTYRINPDVAWRTRLKIAYDIPKFPVNPGLSLEAFYQLNNPDGNRFENLRCKLYFRYKPARHHELEVFGVVDREVNQDVNELMVVAGIGYKYLFK